MGDDDMSDDTTTTPVLSTGTPSLDERITAAANAIALEDDAPPKVAAPTQAEEPEAETDESAEVEAEAADDEEKEAEEKPKKRGKDKGDKGKPRNMVRDLAAEWATARRAQAANSKRAAELEEQARLVETEAATAREIAASMQSDPIKAVERLAALAGITPSQYLQRLQHAYIHGDEDQPQRSASDPVARELAEVRQELERMRAERQQAEAEAQQRAYQQQLVQVAQSETQICSELATNYADEFPELAALDPAVMQRQVGDAVEWFLSNGYQVGRFEVLQAANNVVRKTLDEMGLAGSLRSRVASAPATKVEKTRERAQPRNGSTGRYIPSAAAAAEGRAAPRPLTVEERLREAEKVLWSSE